jgi:hypothetical protein
MNTATSNRTDLVAELTDGDASLITRTYWFGGSEGLRLAVRDLYADLRAVGYEVERQTDKTCFVDRDNLVTTKVKYTTSPDGRRAAVALTLAGFPTTVEDWLTLVRLAVRGGFRVETFGYFQAINLSIEVDEVAL